MTMTLTPQQKIKHLILNLRARFAKEPEPEVTAENVDALYEELDNNEDGRLIDARNEIRQGGEKTGLPRRYHSRHYECEEVATKAPDGSWVGWTHWHGGGKHGEPEAIDWMDDAYDVTCTEQEKMVVVRTFAPV